MPYDLELAERIRNLLPRLELGPEEYVTEVRMFGGLCFSLNGKMLVGVERTRLIVRVRDEDLETGLNEGVLQPMDLTGKPLRNFAYFAPESDDEIVSRISASAEYVRAFMLGKPVKRRARRVYGA